MLTGSSLASTDLQRHPIGQIGNFIDLYSDSNLLVQQQLNPEQNREVLLRNTHSMTSNQLMANQPLQNNIGHRRTLQRGLGPLTAAVTVDFDGEGPKKVTVDQARALMAQKKAESASATLPSFLQPVSQPVHHGMRPKSLEEANAKFSSNKNPKRSNVVSAGGNDSSKRHHRDVRNDLGFSGGANPMVDMLGDDSLVSPSATAGLDGVGSWPVALEQLAGMGFDKGIAQRCLDAANGNVELAVQFLQTTTTTTQLPGHLLLLSSSKQLLRHRLQLLRRSCQQLRLQRWRRHLLK